MWVPEEVDAWGRRQWGLVTRAQLLAVMTASDIYRLRQRGVLVDVEPGVYLLVGSPRSWGQRALALCLTVGPPVALCGVAAGYLHRLEVIAPPQPRVLVPHRRRPRRPDVSRGLLLPSDIGEPVPIPATTPGRTLIDLSCVLDVDGLQKAADDLVRRRLLTPDALRLRLDGPLPRCNLDALRVVVDRLDARGVGDSAREDWIVDTLVGAGLPCPERQVQVEIQGRLLILDCAYVRAKVAIEYDGWREHAGRRHFDGDRNRSFLLQMADWADLRVTSAWTAELLVDRVSEALIRSATQGRRAS